MWRAVAMAMVAVTEPPSDLKTIIDKTASFVARNGPEFETRIKNEQKNEKFSFLQPNDPFHPYYRKMVAELGGAPAAAPAGAGGAATTEASAVTSSAGKSKAPSITRCRAG